MRGLIDWQGVLIARCVTAVTAVPVRAFIKVSSPDITPPFANAAARLPLPPPSTPAPPLPLPLPLLPLLLLCHRELYEERPGPGEGVR